MIFVELRFFYFLALVLAVHWSLRNSRSRKIWLLAASYVFYSAWDWRLLSLILVSTLVDYAVGIALDRPLAASTRRRWVEASLVVNLGLLGIFKYYDFFGESLVALGHWLGVPISHTVVRIVLPVGISFYTFQSLSYTLDIYRGSLKATRDFTDFALFVGFFPQLVAGPIVRAADFLPQLALPRHRAHVPLRACLTLFLVGFIKKACISDNLAPMVDPYFADPGSYTAAFAWLATLSYAVQIYCDFSGYSDMAIATAGLFGYRLCANFDAPYGSVNIAEFWRRWHISLSSWLRDYLYISLGGNRGSRLFTYRNLMLTMLLGGLWHGASWQFVVWGFLHGIALVVHREWRRVFGGVHLPTPLCIGLTFYWVCLAWIFFRATSVSIALQVCESFVLLRSPGVIAPGVGGFIALAGLAIASAPPVRAVVREWWRALPVWAFAALFGGLFTLAFALAPTDAAPFIYFQF